MCELTLRRRDLRLILPLSLTHLILLICSQCLIGLVGCGSNDDLANPFDPDNPRTLGSPGGLKLTPGDQQVVVKWDNPGYESTAGYRIYRKFTGDPSPKFVKVSEVDGQTHQYVDKGGILNDQIDAAGKPYFYVYRVSYVDADGIETPNPADFDKSNGESITDTDAEEILRLWPSQKTTPSDPPPKPEVIVDTSRNLIVTLIWKDYPVPKDFKEFRVSSTVPGGSKFEQVGIPYLLSSPFFFSDVVFNEDGEAKRYRVIAYDKYGVPSVTEIEAAAGHIPPLRPRNFVSRYRSRLNGKYDVALMWEANTEKDLKGYQIYSTKQDEKPFSQGGELAPRRFLQRMETSIILENEGWLLNAKKQLIPKLYYIAAIDKTPRPDTGLQDESILADAPPPPGFEDLVAQ